MTVTSCDTVEDVTYAPYEEEVGIFGYSISIFSGSFLACIISCPFFLIPTENVLKNPEKWYEFQILILLTWAPMMFWITFTLAEYFSDLVVIGKWKTIRFMLLVGYGVYVAGIAIYYYYWTSFLNHVPPMPFNYYIVGSFSCATIPLVLRIRYIHNTHKTPYKGQFSTEGLL